MIQGSIPHISAYDPLGLQGLDSRDSDDAGLVGFRVLALGLAS